LKENDESTEYSFFEMESSKLTIYSFSRQTCGKAAKLLQYFISNLSCSKRQSAEDYLSAEDSTLNLNLLEDHATHAKTLAD
jgi:hypothetical protein